MTSDRERFYEYASISIEDHPRGMNLVMSLYDKLTSVQSKYSLMESQVDEMHRETVRRKAYVEQTEEENRRLNKALEESGKRLEARQYVLTMLKKQYEKAKDDLRERDSRIEELEKELAASRKETEEARKEKIETVLLLGQLTEEREAMLVKISEAEDANKKLAGVLDIRNKMVFGSNSETARSLANYIPARDPLDEDMDPEEDIATDTVSKESVQTAPEEAPADDGEGYGEDPGNGPEGDGQDTEAEDPLRGDHSIEKGLKLLEGMMKRADEPSDPEDKAAGLKDNTSPDGEDQRAGKGKKGHPKGEHRWAGKRKTDLNALDQTFFFNIDADIDLEELKRELEKDPSKSRDYIFSLKRRIAETRPTNYCMNFISLTVKKKDGYGEDTLERLPEKESPLSRFKIHSSTFASVLSKRFGLYLPYNRMEKDYQSRGVGITRKNMCYWVKSFGERVFKPVVGKMETYLGDIRHCDETTEIVVCWDRTQLESDGEHEATGPRRKKNGTKGYYWVLASDELGEGHKVVIFEFNDGSRSSGLLHDKINAYLSEICLVTDGYGVYTKIEKEFGGRVRVARCWMHLRRKFSDAVIVDHRVLKDITEEELAMHPAVRGLIFSSDVFHLDTPLKTLSREERKRLRDELVAPKVDEFFDFVHSVDVTDPRHSGKLVEAIQYALKFEDGFRLFLEDPDIPIDNGEAERSIRGVAMGRRNSLFCYSEEGARNCGYLYSIVETAKRNGADIYYYLKYLIETVPLDEKLHTDKMLEDAMPWSEKYRAYEKYHKEHRTDEYRVGSDEMPDVLRLYKRFRDIFEAA